MKNQLKKRSSVSDILSKAREELSRPITPRNTIEGKYRQYGVKLEPLVKKPQLIMDDETISLEYKNFTKRLESGDFTILRILHNKSQDVRNDIKFFEEGITNLMMRIFRKIQLEKSSLPNEFDFLKRLFLIGILKNVSFECEENARILRKSNFLQTVMIEIRSNYDFRITEEKELEFLSNNENDIDTQPLIELGDRKTVYLIELLSLIRNICSEKFSNMKQVLEYIYMFFFVDSEDLNVNVMRVFSKCSFEMKKPIKNFIRVMFYYLKKYKDNDIIKNRVYFTLNNIFFNNKSLVTVAVTKPRVDLLMNNFSNNSFLLTLISNISVNKSVNQKICSHKQITNLNEFLIEPGKNMKLILSCICNLSFNFNKKNQLFMFKTYFVKNMLTVMKICMQKKNDKVLFQVIQTMINFTKDIEVQELLLELNLVKALNEIVREKIKKKRFVHLILGIFVNLSSNKSFVDEFSLKLLVYLIKAEKGNDKQTIINNLALKVISNLKSHGIDVYSSALEKKKGGFVYKENIKIFNVLI